MGLSSRSASSSNQAYLDQARSFMSELVEVSKLSKAKKGERAEDSDKLVREVSGKVDFVGLAQRSLGKRWWSLDKGERNEFLKTLQGLLEEVAYPQAQKIAVNAEDIDYQYVSQKKEPVVRLYGQFEREKRGEIVLEKVESELVFDSKTKKIVDAVVEGETISTNLRRQFDEALKKKSFGQIVDLMKKRLAKARNKEESKESATAKREQSSLKDTKSSRAVVPSTNKEPKERAEVNLPPKES